MAIRNSLKGGTDFTDGEVLYDYDLDDTFNSFYMKAYADNTGGSSGSATETDLASVTVNTADFNSGSTSVSFLINASIGYKSDNAGTSPTFRLYVNGSIVKTIVVDTSVGNVSARDIAAFTYLSSGNDLSSSNIIVKVTVQWNNTTAVPSASCEGLTVLAMRNN